MAVILLGLAGFVIGMVLSSGREFEATVTLPEMEASQMIFSRETFVSEVSIEEATITYSENQISVRTDEPVAQTIVEINRAWRVVRSAMIKGLLEDSEFVCGDPCSCANDQEGADQPNSQEISLVDFEQSLPYTLDGRIRWEYLGVRASGALLPAIFSAAGCAVGLLVPRNTRLEEADSAKRGDVIFDE